MRSHLYFTSSERWANARFQLSDIVPQQSNQNQLVAKSRQKGQLPVKASAITSSLISGLPGLT